MTRMSQIRQNSMTNMIQMQDFEKKENEMVEKLKTTFMEMHRSQAEIKQLEKGSYKPFKPSLNRSVREIHKIQVNAKPEPLKSQTSKKIYGTTDLTDPIPEIPSNI
jgi:hypothetical protein